VTKTKTIKFEFISLFAPDAETSIATQIVGTSCINLTKVEEVDENTVPVV